MLLIRYLFLWVLTFVVLGFAEDCRAARPTKNLTTSDGLSDILVNSIYKDDRGYVWFGTESAVDRYDGNALVPFPLPKDSRGRGRVNAVLRVKTGDVYVGSNAGLCVIYNGTETPQAILADKINSQVTALATDGRQNLYIATDQGVFCYNFQRKNVQKLNPNRDLRKPDNHFADLLVQDGRVLWAATAHTLFKYIIDSDHTLSYPIPEGECTNIVQMGDKLCLGLRGVGVVTFDIATSEFGEPIAVGNNLITGLAVDRDFKLYISTDGEGIFRFSPADSRFDAHFSTTDGRNSLKSNSVYSLMVDDLGLLWAGYYQMGVEYTPNYRSYFSTYTLEKGGSQRGVSQGGSQGGVSQGGVESVNKVVFDSKPYAVRSVAIDGQKKIIGTRDGLFVVDEQTGTVRRYSKPVLRSNMIFCIYPVENHRFLIGTYNGGMYTLDTSTGLLSDFDSAGTIGNATTVFSIVNDDRGNLWAATSAGLIRFRNGLPPQVFTSRNSPLPDGNVYEIFFDSAGRGWICTENGMAIWDGENLTTNRFPVDFIHKQKIRDIFEDSSHNLYFAPDRGSLFRSDLSLTKYGPVTFSADENVTVMFIVEDKDGWLWFGTDKGLIRYDKEENFHHFNNADGLPNQVFTLCSPVRDSNGDLWMGNSSGLIRLDFEKFRLSDADDHHPLKVTNLMSRGKSIISRMRKSRKSLSINLTGDENELVVYVSDFSYKSPEHFVTEYLLEGGSEFWRRTDGSKPIHLYDLPLGDYRLRLRVQDDPRTETILTIHKASNTSWALIFIIVLLSAGICYTLYILYKRHYQRRDEYGDDYTYGSGADGSGADGAGSDGSGADGGAAEKERHISYKTTRLSDEECKRLMKALTSVMNNDKPYTNPDLKSSDLAAMIGTKSHSLSFLFNQYLKKSFYDYVNEYRVNEFKRLVKESDISKYTLTALSEKCGFSSRASFFRHFKAITGVTPAEFIKNK